MKKILFLAVIVVSLFLIKIDQEFEPRNLNELQKIAQEKTEKKIDEEFTTDGCSMFPNKINRVDLTDVCIEHDMAYWAGGNKNKRMEADLRLREKINEKINFLGDIMYWASRIGGHSSLPTPWRWGYGCS